MDPAQFEKHVVGGRQHEELWVPAEELDQFNAKIIGPIRVLDVFYGEHYSGPRDIPVTAQGMASPSESVEKPGR